MKKIKKNQLTIIFSFSFFILISLIAYMFKIRLCIIYNLFKIPCPSCGITRAGVYALKRDINTSLKYNRYGILIIFLIIVYCVLIVLDKEDKINKFLFKYKFIVIPIVIVILISSWIINLKNPLLY